MPKNLIELWGTGWEKKIIMKTIQNVEFKQDIVWQSTIEKNYWGEEDPTFQNIGLFIVIIFWIFFSINVHCFFEFSDKWNIKFCSVPIGLSFYRERAS